ncbi:hypothetical protein ACD661_00045 [Legionella lytica]|uniref:Uncharacterized protein n=1 Tax=Legionella lytica TaxID=96232 RepID=A0ABW8D5S0_9GAMM
MPNREYESLKAIQLRLAQREAARMQEPAKPVVHRYINPQDPEAIRSALSLSTPPRLGSPMPHLASNAFDTASKNAAQLGQSNAFAMRAEPFHRPRSPRFFPVSGPEGRSPQQHYRELELEPSQNRTEASANPGPKLALAQGSKVRVLRALKKISPLERQAGLNESQTENGEIAGIINGWSTSTAKSIPDSPTTSIKEMLLERDFFAGTAARSLRARFKPPALELTAITAHDSETSESLVPRAPLTDRSFLFPSATQQGAVQPCVDVNLETESLSYFLTPR